MPWHNGGTTSPTLLRRAADWTDLPAWIELNERYDPLLRRWCAAALLDESDLNEVIQRIWIELSERMVGFRYDPRRSFRGWLRELCRSRLIDFLRARDRDRKRLENLLNPSNPLAQACWLDRGLEDDDSGEVSPDREFILSETEQAQAQVRAKVSAKTWDAYWRIAIQDEPIADVAASLGLSYAAAYAAYTRVDQRLREEGRRRLAAISRAAVSEPYGES